MPGELNHIRDAVASVAQDARAAVDRANSEVRGRFALAGRTGSGSMRRAIQDAVADVFREAATKMAAKARAFAGGPRADVSQLVDQALEQLIDWVLANYFHDGWDQEFRPNLTRYKNDAVTELMHMPTIASGGTSIQITAPGGNINVAAGAGNTANQAVRGADIADVASLVGQLKDVVLTAQVTEDQRLEMQDHVEVLEIEAVKATPDRGKLARGAKRLMETAEKVGVAAVGPVTTALLKAIGL